MALLCFCRRDLSLPVCTDVCAVDASEWGAGVVTTKAAEDEIMTMLTFSERWRFAPGEASAREQTLDAERRKSSRKHSTGAPRTSDWCNRGGDAPRAGRGVGPRADP